MPGKPSKFRGSHGLGAIRSVPEFRTFIAQQASMTVDEKLSLIVQAEILIVGFYTHMHLKHAMHAIDPEQRLKLLRHRFRSMSDREFHSDLLDIFTELRDLHTNYTLPAPYSGRVAFLGILVEQYFEADESAHWMISKVARHLVADASLVKGVEVTHWNGMPMGLAVWRNADKEAGSNSPARLARGLEALTLRWMSSSLPPDEDWVVLTFRSGNATRETRLDWHVYDSITEFLTPAVSPSGLLDSIRTPLRYQLAEDIKAHKLRESKKQLFNPAAVKEEARVQKYNGVVPRITKDLSEANAIVTSRPDDLSARLVQTTNGTFGYLRLWTFHMKDSKIVDFLLEVIRLLENEFPSEGLIIDVRGNGGGYVIAAEFLLQLLTPNHIKPEPSQFVATPTTLEFANQEPSMTPWRASLQQAVQTGAQYSKGVPLSDEDVVNSIGQIYFGPIVLITDAYCYSACDMFAAGFQDHGIGTILGVDETTGAGGANVVTHENLVDDWVNGPMESLPGGAGMRISFRRTLRVGERAGQPVEDLGVEPDVMHLMTENDLLNHNEDLLNRAGEILGTGVTRVLEVSISRQGQSLSIQLSTQRVPSIDVYVDGRPRTFSQTPDGTKTLTVTNIPQNVELRINGYDGGQLVASRFFAQVP